jgi:hypothetical protein
MRRRNQSPMWKYLEASGVLEKGSDDQIKAVKKAYRKKYFLDFKQKQRKIKPEFAVTFSKSTGEYGRVSRAAKLHNMTMTSFIQAATLAYIENTFIVPDKVQVARIEQLLGDCLNEIKNIMRPREKHFWERDRKLDNIEKLIEKLEIYINEVLRHPPLAYDRQNKIA